MLTEPPWYSARRSADASRGLHSCTERQARRAAAALGAPTSTVRADRRRACSAPSPVLLGRAQQERLSPRPCTPPMLTAEPALHSRGSPPLLAAAMTATVALATSPRAATTRAPSTTPPPGISWGTVAGLGAIHLGAAIGLVYLILRPSVPTLLLAGTMYLLGGLSITAGYHRLFAHRTYRASAPVRWFFLAFGRRRSRTRRCRGAPTTERTTPTPTDQAIRTPSRRACGGRTWAGCSTDGSARPTSAA